MRIHKTAIIEKGVNLGKNITIGPYSIVHQKTTIEDGVSIGSHCVIGALPEIINNSDISSLLIRKNTVIGNFVSISLGTVGKTTVGENCYIMNFSYIAHDVTIGQNIIMTAGVNILGNVKIEDEVYLGSNSVVHQNSTLKELSCLGANSFAKGTLLGGLIYIGNPAKAVKLNKVGIERSSKQLSHLKVLTKEALYNLSII
jgi:UDP-N-acetylglucosamine acyltransferase